MKRKLFLTSFALVSLLALGIVGYALKYQKWDTATAALSLLIAIVSAWVAYEVFHRQDEARRPQLMLSVDTDSRYMMIQLVCKNNGELAAYNINVKWNKPLINNELKPTSFNYSGIGPEISVLNPKEARHTWVTTDIEFYKPENDYEMEYSGFIHFQESLNSAKIIAQPFAFSLTRYGRTLAAKSEDIVTMKEIQKIPSALAAMTKEINQLRIDIKAKK